MLWNHVKGYFHKPPMEKGCGGIWTIFVALHSKKERFSTWDFKWWIGDVLFICWNKTNGVHTSWRCLVGLWTLDKSHEVYLDNPSRYGRYFPTACEDINFTNVTQGHNCRSLGAGNTPCCLCTQVRLPRKHSQPNITSVWMSFWGLCRKLLLHACKDTCR